MILLLFTILIGLIPLILVFFRKNKNTDEVSNLFPFLIIVFIASLYELIGSIILKINVNYWFVIYNLLVFITLFYFFYRILCRYRLLFFIFFTLFIFLLFYLFLNYSFEDFFIISPYFKGFQTIFILTFSILWFRKLFNERIIENLIDCSVFYFISGLIIYYCGTFFLFLLNDFIYKSDEKAFHDFWLLNIILNLVLRTLLIVGIWKARVK